MIYLANSSKMNIGGGWSFLANLKNALSKKDETKNLITPNYEQSQVYFIASPTMVQRDEVTKAKNDGKKIVLRLDNAVRDSRNRNTGMPRMQDFAKWADVVIYQSEWAKKYLYPFTQVDGPVILNGVDQDIFKPKQKPEEHVYIYSRYNRDETKNWEVARYSFSQIAQEEPNAKLYIVGQFSPDLQSANFDFYMNEQYQFVGVVTDPHVMAKYYQESNYLLFTFFNDACSNTLIEALSCGCEVSDDYGMAGTGGSTEIINLFYTEGSEYFGLDRMANAYVEAINAL